MVHVYIGDGKGKTTAALGLALRASGWGRRVYVCQFLKGCKLACGEKKSAVRLSIKFERFADQVHPMFTDNDSEQRLTTIKSVNKGLDRVERCILRNRFDLIVLDEILSAYMSQLVKISRIKAIMKMAKDIELVLTGRRAPMSILKKSDYVSRIEKIKHPFDEGISARKGIEF